LGGLLFAALLLAWGCESTAPPTGGETHFLRWCATDGAACGPGLQCVCGVCTVPCSESDSCAGYPDAACVGSGADACTDAPAAGICDVGCSDDTECLVLSPTHRCEGNVCRAPAPNAPPGGSSGAPSGEPPTRCAEEEGVSGNQVLVIGDSFFAISHEITAYVEALAREAGALAEGERYRDNSRLLGNTLALAGNGIEEQYTTALAEGDVEVVIMNGGGADVFLGTCEPVTDDCPIFVEAAAAARDLLASMADDGVAHVVYAFYPDPVDPPLREKMDALRPQLEAVCAQSPVPCHWLDLRPAFEGRYDEYIRPDGKNPTSDGARAAAVAIWETMQTHCIAQRTSG